MNADPLECHALESLEADVRAVRDAMLTADAARAADIAIGPMLDDLDPIQLAQQAELVDRLREAGRWSDADEAQNQIDIATRAAEYQSVSS